MHEIHYLRRSLLWVCIITNLKWLPTSVGGRVSLVVAHGQCLATHFALKRTIICVSLKVILQV